MSATKEQKPSHSQLNSLLEHYQSGRYEDAEKLAISITQQFPEHQFGWKVLGSVLKQTGRISEALVASQKSLKLAPQDAGAHCNLGNTFKELGRLEDAEASYREAIELKTDFAEAHYNLGTTMQELSRLDEAEASYRQAIVLRPDFAEAHNNLGNTLKDLGRLEDAEANYREAIELNPDYVEAHINLGITLQELSRLEEAEASYRQAIALKPDFAEVYSNLGVTLLELGRLEAAEVCYKKYISLEPDKSGPFVSRGDILFNEEKFELALSAFDSYNTKESRGRALECLYALGRVGDIYERIEAQANIDGENLRVAAFAAFIAEREKKETTHNFCKNPINFIHFANISSHLEGTNLFISEVIDELSNVKTSWEPLNKATRNGFQASIDVFKNPLEKMRLLQSIIIDELDVYYSKFRSESCFYIQKWPSQKKISGWHVILRQQGYQTAHIHPNGWLSGVIYLSVVPSLGKNEGAIEFSLNGSNYSDVGSSKLMYKPKLGDIVFFPSSLHHRTLPFSTDMDRITVSFDLMPEATSH